MFDLSDAVGVFGLFLAIYSFYQLTLMREQAYKIAEQHCKTHELQLLDQNVAIKRLWFKRDSNRYWHIWLSFHFEFSSTGEERYIGKVILLGGKLQNIILPAYRMPTNDTDIND